MTNKERYIRAFRETIDRYRNPKGKSFFNVHTCKICEISKNSDGHRCAVCPMGERFSGSVWPGCAEMSSYKQAVGSVVLLCTSSFANATPTPEMLHRSDVLESMIPILESWPEELFTKCGFKPLVWKAVGID